MNPGNSKELSQKSKSRNILYPQKIIERVNKILSFIAKNMIEYLLIVIANDLAMKRYTHPEDPNPLSLR